MKLWKVALVVAVLSLGAGCASAPLNKRADNQTLAPPASQSSRIVFLRPSNFGYAISAVLFDVTNDDPQLLGISSAGSKMVYDVPPGPRRLMVYSEAADFMEAKLAPGKTYYAVVTPRMGAWKARFSLMPMKASSSNEFNLNNKDLEVWVKSGTLVEKIPEADAWFQKNGAAVRKTKAEYETVWKQKTPQDVLERTLEEQDGVVAK